jgi:hypothetical protein
VATSGPFTPIFGPGGPAVICYCEAKFSLYCSTAEENLAALQAEMAQYMVNWIATSTQRSYGAYVRYYMDFCTQFGFRPLQPEELTVCLYVTKLAQTCQYRTIKSYLNGVRVLHLEAGLMNPLPTMFNLERTLSGIKRVKGDRCPIRKLAITPEILSRIIQRLDLFLPVNMAFVAAMLVAFLGFFPEGQCLPSQGRFQPGPGFVPSASLRF